ncbi:hypothetical protein PC121_g13824 [Phytophthora cactorum]|nr:hypothetical protein PC120_g14563 [Phytophthora cactorum]KAG3059705.1 hypothetical protein PC121_g13824 [Phytophthora cactorum]KAG4052376.1 hypothetical protein PC123_g12443 [Phytophthora cactorum]
MGLTLDLPRRITGRLPHITPSYPMRFALPCTRELQHHRNTGEPSIVEPERLKSVLHLLAVRGSVPTKQLIPIIDRWARGRHGIGRSAAWLTSHPH